VVQEERKRIKRRENMRFMRSLIVIKIYGKKERWKANVEL